VRLSEEKLIKPLVDIPRMADLAQQMVRNVLSAYVHGEPQAAHVGEGDFDFMQN